MVTQVVRPGAFHVSPVVTVGIVPVSHIHVEINGYPTHFTAFGTLRNSRSILKGIDELAMSIRPELLLIRRSRFVAIP
jgi:hypothetical protein